MAGNDMDCFLFYFIMLFIVTQFLFKLFYSHEATSVTIHGALHLAARHTASKTAVATTDVAMKSDMVLQRMGIGR